jgi:hypothetical protein
MPRKHSYQTRLRAFRIWQQLGYNPWAKPRGGSRWAGAGPRKGKGDFYKGAFDSIPFLNDDAKRTFTHLLLRPGYMIRDYIKGAHERYLAPLTALIVFYAFFALISAVLQPVQQRGDSEILSLEDDMEVTLDSPNAKVEGIVKNVALIVRQGYYYLNLDRHPELVDTRTKGAVAALEGTLRSQGIPLFLGEFLFLWTAMGLCLRKQQVGWSAAAAASAYVLCQFCFFMLFAVLLTWGESTSVSIILMLLLITLDYRQWLGLRWRKSIGLAFRTGVVYVLLYGLIILLVSLVVLAFAWTKGAD